MTASLDSLEEAPLETSDAWPGQLAPDYYGSIENHDGFQPSLPRESQFRHAGWAAPRARIYAALLRTGATARRVQHFCECGSALWLLRDGREVELACNRCHDRLCLPCQKQRQTAVIEGIMLKMLDGGGECRFVTLTLKHGDAPLSVQIERLTSSFKNLRKHPAVASRLQGGAWFLEVKLSKDKHRWHPHLHIIAKGSFIPQRELSKAWYETTGDSYIVDVQAIGDPRKRAAYVTKYATKPLANEVTLQPAKLDEFIAAIKGKRLYQCFGDWAGAVRREPPPKRKLESVGRFDSIWREACRGDVQAMVLVHLAYARWPRLKTSFPLPRDLMPDEPGATPSG